MSDIYILSAARTPIGTFGGSLASLAPIDLAGSVKGTSLEAEQGGR